MRGLARSRRGAVALRDARRLQGQRGRKRDQQQRGLCYFLTEHLGYPIPSPALFRPLHDRFVTAVQAFAQRHDVPLITFEPKQRKDDVVADYPARLHGA